jgi:hypothetical protein
LPQWPAARPDLGEAADPQVQAARDRLLALRREELRLTGSELEQRAGAVILLTRRLEALRSDAPREVAAVESAARRLARTLAAPEFRNLEARRTAGAAHLAEIDRRLGAIREAGEAAEVLRAADPATIAHLSLRPVRDDLAAADAATAALVRALGAEVPAVAARATARYQEPRAEVEWEVRHAVSGGAGLRLVRIETRAFRGAGRPGQPLSLTHAAGEEAPRPLPSGAWLDLGSAPRNASVVAAWTEPVTPRPVRSTLRPLAFERLEFATSTVADDAVMVILLDGHPGIEMPLAVPLPPPSLARVTVPRHALFFASGPGAAVQEADGDRWVPAGDAVGSTALDLVPRRLLLRNQPLARLRPYLYRPNLLTVAALIGAAALTLVLVGRRRAALPATG